MPSRRLLRRSCLIAACSLVALGTLATLAAPRPAFAETKRVAVVVGHNTGDASERPLRYAEDDAGKLADVLVELGDVERSRLFVVRGKPRDFVVDALTRAAATVKAVRTAPDDRVLLTFFYSGHSDAAGLQLGDTRLAYGELKRLLDDSGAEVRLTIVDGCKSGGLVAAKGGKPAPAFEIGLSDQLSSVGEATLTSSAADEASLESSEIRGSFFTHHLVSGLRGAADSSGDGRVTLSEAYEYAFNRTVVASAATGSAPQHPNYDYQLSGGGELVLTRVGERSAALRLPAGFARVLVTNVLRDQVVAELTRDEVRLLAVLPGDYAVRLWRSGEVLVGRVKAQPNRVVDVEWAKLSKATAAPVAGKGEEPAPVAQAPYVTPPSGVLGVAPGEPSLLPEAQAIWDRDLLVVEDVSVVRAQGGWSGNSTTPTAANKVRLFRGRFRKNIEPLDFLRLAGRKDLVRRMESRRDLKIGVYLGGGLAAVGGLVWAASLEPGDAALVPALSLSLVGEVAVFWGWLLIGDGAPEGAELREVAETHNRNLRARLRGEVSAATTPVTPRWQLAPVVTPSGAALSLLGTF